MAPTDPLLAALAPLVARVRTDVTARKGESGRQAWTREPLTAERLARHLNGGPARGVSQIKAGESVTMVGVLDLDSHGGEVSWGEMVRVARDVMLSLELLGGAPVAWRSSGGRGVHLYCLWDQGQDAYSVRQWLGAALESCGLRSGAGGLGKGQVEVFPKQDSVPADGFGNQVVLPLAGASVPLVWCDLADTLVPGTREDALAVVWGVSDPVPRLERPVRRRGPLDPERGDLQSLLDAIPNGRDGVGELDYDSWLGLVFAIHHETGGSPAGLELAHQVSERSQKYDAAFLDERIWPYVHSDGRGAVRGLGTIKRIAGLWGWHEPLDEGAWEDVSAADDAPPLPVARVEVREPEAEFEVMAEAASSGVGAGVLPIAPAPPAKAIKRRGIPEAQHLTTDQANANRLVAAFGRQVLVAAGRWHVWDGRRWAADESDVYRFACRLSGIIKQEAQEVRARGAAQSDPAEAQKAAGIADALLKWAQKSEMKAGIEAAIGLARKMLTVDEKLLDRDPMVVNVENGILDLRTGKLRRHDPDELLTKIIPVAYVEGAECPVWERTLLQITRENWEEQGVWRVGMRPRPTPVADYLRRWFGYCLTGMVNEQVFVVHWGGGSNGKSTLLTLMAETAGDYACTAPPGLVAAGKGERHPTEIASLMGRRMVTAHESGEGVVLREDFIKQATGEDVLSARFMRGDFFDFAPTHKLQLLTNHKPAIKGQDAGIWRRVQLVAYLGSWGTEEEVREGKRGAVKDIGLLDKLRGELEGVLAWRVRGAMEWVSGGGLNPPAGVRAASDAYKSEQDRVGQFIEECCEVGVGIEGCEVALTDGMGGLYPAYVSWCKDGGLWPVSKLRFVDDVLRVVAGAVAIDRKSAAVDGRRRKLKMIQGLRLLPE